MLVYVHVDYCYSCYNILFVRGEGVSTLNYQAYMLHPHIFTAL